MRQKKIEWCIQWRTKMKSLDKMYDPVLYISHCSKLYLECAKYCLKNSFWIVFPKKIQSHIAFITLMSRLIRKWTKPKGLNDLYQWYDFVFLYCQRRRMGMFFHILKIIGSIVMWMVKRQCTHHAKGDRAVEFSTQILLRKI